MEEIATRDHWKLLPEPSEREWIELAMNFSDWELEKLKRGHIPSVMEDRWFIFFENDWVFFCRSWTGAVTFGVRLETSAQGARVIEAWANRDPEQSWSSSQPGKSLLRDLIRFLLDWDGE